VKKTGFVGQNTGEEKNAQRPQDICSEWVSLEYLEYSSVPVEKEPSEARKKNHLRDL
jgi:hypothetical protein